MLSNISRERTRKVYFTANKGGTMKQSTRESIIEAAIMFGIMALVFGFMIYVEAVLW